MSFNDDEQIDASQASGSTLPTLVRGRVQLRSINNIKVPLEESKLRVMLEITGGVSTSDRPGLDLVAVLDVSGSMDGEKIAKAKTAMLFVIKKLSPIDRLSVVTFSSTAARLSPLRQMTESSQKDFEGQISGLTADAFTNIKDGLETGLKVINDRKLSVGRVVGIILMSDGNQNIGNAAEVKVGNVPVYTFGFGIDHDPRVLRDIAANSLGGTFSDVENMDNLGIAFSRCLAGLLTVVVQDLKLTVMRYEKESTIEQVLAGSYEQSKDDAAGYVTIKFGDLYSKEVRRVIVDLLLPATSQERSADVLKITYSYSTGGKKFDANPVTLTVRRTGKSGEQQERPEVIIEDTRVQTARTIREARVMADGNNLDNARNKLVEAQNLLEGEVHDSNMLIEMLRSELQHLSKLMESKELYEKQGRPFALSSEISHDRQRFATRGHDVKSQPRLFSTPRMDEYLKQAKSFEEDPSKQLPTVNEDWKKEVAAAAHPLAGIARAVCDLIIVGLVAAFYFMKAFKFLQRLKNCLNRGR